MGTIFLYDVEFTPEANPPGRKDELEDSLKGFFLSSDLRLSHGGARRHAAHLRGRLARVGRSLGVRP
jgi:hypothetical protein